MGKIRESGKGGFYCLIIARPRGAEDFYVHVCCRKMNEGSIESFEKKGTCIWAIQCIGGLDGLWSKI
jgi:hypothetical protein